MERAGQDGLSWKEIDRLDQDFAALQRDIYRERRDEDRHHPGRR